MKSMGLRLFVVSASLGALIGGIYPLIVDDGASVLLEDQSLSLLRGADKDFSTFQATSCDSAAKTALSQVTGKPVIPDGGCASVNLGWPCGARCTNSVSGNYGVASTPNPFGRGQWNMDRVCGFLIGGKCGASFPPTNPPTYACIGAGQVYDANHNPYSCSDINTVQSQSG